MSNMYEFTPNTKNFIGGECLYKCKYCYVNALKKRNKIINNKYSGEPFLCKKEFKKSLGKSKYWFIGSMIDMFAPNVSSEWIAMILNHCYQFDNTYLFQSKNPARFYNCTFPPKTILATTIESNRHYSSEYGKAITVDFRTYLMAGLKYHKRMVSIEPIMDFDIDELVKMMKQINPIQINIGADSKGHSLPEPSAEKISRLISECEKFSTVHQKKNLKRLL